jgi:hypothetical protein
MVIFSCHSYRLCHHRIGGLVSFMGLLLWFAFGATACELKQSLPAGPGQNSQVDAHQTWTESDPTHIQNGSDLVHTSSAATKAPAQRQSSKGSSQSSNTAQSFGNVASCPTRGDVNDDGEVTIADASALLSHLFNGIVAPAQAQALDANSDSQVDISDPLFILTYLFQGGSAPSPIVCRCGWDEEQSIAKTYLIDDVVGAAIELSETMETTRQLPAYISLGAEDVIPEQFLNLASMAIDQLANDAQAIHFTIFGESGPGILTYESTPLEADFYDSPFLKEDYQAFYRSVCNRTSQGSGPQTAYNVGVGAQFRGVETLYYAAHILRYIGFFGQFPEHIQKNIISPQGFFPWDTPAGLENYTSVLTNRVLVPTNPIPFGTHHWTGFYNSYPAHHFEVFQMAQEIVAGAQNAFDAGKQIYDWARNMNGRWFYAQGSITQLGLMGGSQFGEILHKQWGTSGLPRHIMALLVRAVGIPVSPAGAIYLNGAWVNLDQHRPYASSLANNPFYYDSLDSPQTYNVPGPQAFHAPVNRIQSIAQQAQTLSAGPAQKSFYINARDVDRYGASSLVEKAVAGGFSTIIFTVKSEEGTTYFSHRSNRLRPEDDDHLAAVLGQAHGQGVAVWASLSTLIDRSKAQNIGWRQQLSGTYQGNYLQNLHLSPCSTEVRQYLGDLVEDLAQYYPIDGLVLSGHYFGGYWASLGWDTNAHPECPTTDATWPQAQLTSLADELFTHLHTWRPEATRVVMSFALGHENNLPQFNPEVLGQQDLAGLESVSDHIMLILDGNFWTSAEPGLDLPQILLDTYTSSFNQEPFLSMYISDEWIYAGDFYSNVAQVSAAQGWSHLNFHTTLSLSNQYRSSLTPSLVEMIARQSP